MLPRLRKPDSENSGPSDTRWVRWLTNGPALPPLTTETSVILRLVVRAEHARGLKLPKRPPAREGGLFGRIQAPRLAFSELKLLQEPGVNRHHRHQRRTGGDKPWPDLSVCAGVTTNFGSAPPAAADVGDPVEIGLR